MFGVDRVIEVSQQSTPPTSLLESFDGISSLRPVPMGGIFPVVGKTQVRGIPPDGGVPHLLHRDSDGFTPVKVDYPLSE